MARFKSTPAIDGQTDTVGVGTEVMYRRRRWDENSQRPITDSTTNNFITTNDNQLGGIGTTQTFEENVNEHRNSVLTNGQECCCDIVTTSPNLRRISSPLPRLPKRAPNFSPSYVSMFLIDLLLLICCGYGSASLVAKTAAVNNHQQVAPQHASLVQPPRQFNNIPNSNQQQQQQQASSLTTNPERFPQHKPPLYQTFTNELQQPTFQAAARPQTPTSHSGQRLQNGQNSPSNLQTISAAQPPTPALKGSNKTPTTDFPALVNGVSSGVTISADQPKPVPTASPPVTNSKNSLEKKSSGKSHTNLKQQQNSMLLLEKPVKLHSAQQIKLNGNQSLSSSPIATTHTPPDLLNVQSANSNITGRRASSTTFRLDGSQPQPKPMTMRAFPGIASAELHYGASEAASARLEQVARANSLNPSSPISANLYDASSGQPPAAASEYNTPANVAVAASASRFATAHIPPLPAPQLYNAGYPPPSVIINKSPALGGQLQQLPPLLPPGPEAAVGELFNPPPPPPIHAASAAYGTIPIDPLIYGGVVDGSGLGGVVQIDPYAAYPLPYVPQQQQSYMKRYPSPHYPHVKLPPISPLEIQQRAEYAAQKVEQLFTQVEPDLFKRGLTLLPNSSAALHAAFTKTGLKAKQLSKAALIALDVTKSLAHDYQLTGEQIQYALPLLPIGHTVIGEYCLSPKVEPCSCKPSPYREIDGFCNNPYHPEWGRSFTAFARWLPSDYADHVDAPRTYSVSHKPLPSARAVSAHIHPDYDRPHCHFTLLLMQMGQFVDHDISHAAATVQNTGYGNVADIKCCDVPWGVVGHPSCFPIEIPYDDPFYSKFQQKCMDFRRNEAAPRPPGGCPLGPREQLNQLTSYLDASGIYGSTYEENQKLRAYEYGKLKTVFLDYCHRDILPPDHEALDCADANATYPCFKAGDQRVNEVTGLTALHTLFVREHNRICDELHFLNPHWEDERLFQEGRKILTAFYQHIIYNEFLPIVLGKDVMHQFDLLPRKKGYYEFYDKTLNPSISAVFSTAAFRYGHTLIQSSYKFFNKRHELVGHLRLRDAFFKPFDLYKGGAMDEFVLALINDNVQKRDNFLTSEITNHLFQRKHHDFGMDLAALNVQRARDHGVPSYNHWREFCGLPRAYSFYDLKDVMRPEVVELFQHVYEHVDDIDIFPAGISEEPLHDGLLGPTLTCLLTKQFVLLKKADRFWYETDQKPHRFTESQLDEIRSVKMSSIICNNGDHLDTIQPNVFLTTLPIVNERVKCELIKPLDLRPWKEITDKQIYIRDAVKGVVQDLAQDLASAFGSAASGDHYRYVSRIEL